MCLQLKHLSYCLLSSVKTAVSLVSWGSSSSPVFIICIHLMPFHTYNSLQYYLNQRIWAPIFSIVVCFMWLLSWCDVGLATVVVL